MSSDWGNHLSGDLGSNVCIGAGPTAATHAHRVRSSSARASYVRKGATGLLLAASMALSGCADGLALNGSVFDLLGVSENALSKKQEEPKLAERAPLVLPPNASRLPEPGTGVAVEKGDMNWPTEPEQRKAAEAKERERLHLAYCSGQMNWQKNALDPQSVERYKSPYGPCPGLGNIIKSNVNTE